MTFPFKGTPLCWFDTFGNDLCDMSWSTCEINPCVMGRQSGWCHEPGNYKACPNKAVTSFFCLHRCSVWNRPCLIWCCLSVFNYSEMASKQQQAFRMCVHEQELPALFNGWRYTRSLCCLFGRGACTVSARERWLWALQCASLANTPIPPGVISQWGRSGSRSPWLWSRCCRGMAKAAVLGFANRSFSGVRDGHSLISAFTWEVQCLFSGLESKRPDLGTDTSTIWFWGIICC